MTNTTEATLNWVRGLSSYFEYEGDLEAYKFMQFLEKAMYSDNPVIDTTNSNGMVEFISVLRKFAPNKVFDIFHKYYRNGYDSKSLQDGFSRGQVKSKIWLAEELKKISPSFENILLLAGWFGQARLYFDIANVEYNNILTVDLDPVAGKVSDTIFNLDLLEGWKMKSSTENISKLVHYEDSCFVPLETSDKTILKKFVPNLIVNTSSEHMDEEWFYKIKTDSVIAIQSNNLFDIPEHVNCVHSIDEMKKKFKMSEILYEGELELYGYKRFMLIGRK
jgi:hypothetical protein